MSEHLILFLGRKAGKLHALITTIVYTARERQHITIATNGQDAFQHLLNRIRSEHPDEYESLRPYIHQVRRCNP